MSERSFGTDLGTFMHPAFWGMPSRDDVSAAAIKDPKPLWDKILDTAHSAGLNTLELTFPPLDVQTASRAYGSLDGFAEQLAARGLGVHCSYFGGLESGADLTSEKVRAGIVSDVSVESAALAQLGAQFLVLGLPAYPEGTGSPVDPRYLRDLAPLIDRIGATAAAQGLRTALHTEAYSVFWQPEDIAALLTLTDPTLVGFCPDAGHIALAGASPARVLAEHRDRYLLAHWKDTSAVAPGGPIRRDELWGWLAGVFVPPGQGIVDWPAWVRELQQVSDASTVILEIDEAAHPVAALTSARTYISSLLDGARPEPVGKDLS